MRTLADVGRALAHPTRAGALQILMSGDFLSMTDLARICRTSSSSMSEHLSLLLQAGLVRVVSSGRHRYFTLASTDVANLVEAAGIVATDRPARRNLADSERDRLESEGRLCWHHLAGKLGIMVRTILILNGSLEERGDDAIVTTIGKRFFERELEIEAESSLIVPSCVDFTERRFHMRGSLASEMARTFTERQWIRRGPGRAVLLTEMGRETLKSWNRSGLT